MPNYRNKNKGRKNKNHKKNQNNSKKNLQPTTQTDVTVAESQSTEQSERSQLNSERDCPNQLLTPLQHETIATADNETVRDCENPIRPDKLSDNNVICKEEDDIIREVAPIEMGLKSSKPFTPTDPDSSNSYEGKPGEGNSQLGKVIVHRVIQESDGVAEKAGDDLESGQNECKDLTENVKVIIHTVVIEEPNDKEQSYHVELPETAVKEDYYSESEDKEIQIQEVSDGSLSDYNDNPPLVSEVESEPEAVLSPSNSAYTIDTYCEESKSTACYEDLKQRRVQKRVALEAHFLPQLLTPRYLDSISEENSDVSDARSDCSDNSSVRSIVSASTTDCSTADNDPKTKKANSIYPRSNLDFSRRHKHGPYPKTLTLPCAIREESPMVVETKLIVLPEYQSMESCSTLSSVHEQESEEAEVVYINSASSSASDLLELDLEKTAADALKGINLDTDVREIITQPFNTKAESSSRESTPVNQLTAEELNLEMEITTSNKKSGTLCEEQNNAHITNQEDQISSLADVLSCRGESQRFNNDAERNSDSESFTNAQYSDSETLTSSNSNSFCVDQTVKQINLLENFQMDNVREIVNNNFNKLDNEDNIDNQLKDNIKEDCVRSTVVSPSEARVDHFARDSPPPLPPPPHMVDISSAEQPQYENFEFLKSNNNGLTRQESADSHCSNSTTHSQCTAINVGASKHSKIDVDVISSFSENHNDSANCRSVTELSSKCSSYPEQGPNEAALKKLRQLCAEALASMPYGQEVLEELASVAQNIGEVHAVNSASITKKMPYPIPDLPHISDLQLSTGSTPQEEHSVAITQLHSEQTSKLSSTTPSPPPPPVPAPPSRNDAWLGLPSESNPKLLVCLSPFQRTCISENGNPSANNPDLLLDAHQKFLERRGYHEYSIDQVKAMNSEKLEEQQILKTASIMKKLRKSLTPPPIPPPPVPSKSCETAAKAQIQAKATIDRNDTSFSSGCTNEKAALYSDGEENKHRLLAIIHDTDDSKQNLIPKTSSFQNNSRQTAVEQGEPLAPEPEPRHTTQQPTHQENVRTDLHFAKSDQHSPSQPLRSASTGEDIFNKTGDIDISMQTVGGACVGAAGGHTNLYDEGQRRFSNIESYSNTPYSSQILNTQPKRFSNIETHSYESKKRIENGQVVLDFSTSNHESHREGDLPGNSVPQQSLSTDESKIVAEISSNSGKSNGMDVKVHGEFTNKATPTSTEEIMSALNLNTNHLKTTKGSSLVDVEKSEDRTATKLNREINERRNVFINRQQSENNSSNKDINGGSTYDEFRQRAKAAAEAASAAPSTAPISFSGDKLGKSSFHFDHENLFKDFDELSKQLHMELETGKAQRLRRDQEREKSASLYDLSGMQKHFNSQCEEMKKRRHEHMQELEREIERSMRSRQLRNLSKPRDDISRNSNLTAESDSKTFQIPIQIEGDQPASQSATTSYSPQGGRTFEIPVQVADTPQTTLNHQNSEQIDHSRFRRAESMFDVTDNVSQRHRQRSTSINNESHVDADDWSRYATDLGSSQNITRPFAREVEICYQRLRPNAIKAPRLSASTNDLSTSTHGFDAYNNAYHSRRAYAPMLNPVAQKSRPQYLSCTSMIERDPNPTYISTTSRRGASPAPPSLQTTDSRSIFEQDRPTIQRRASLPRELHEQQLKYIASKEEELRTEFERLESERQRLLDEMNRAQPVHTPSQRPKKEFYRTAPKLPTLSEDEVFRQQMAEEWLNKIAEREERRLQKIIKISKLNEEGDGHPINVTHTHMGSTNADIGEEFLNRVKERRSKLCMPADSDWESGAESQPQPFSQGQESDIDELPPVKVIDGKSETNINQLPKHLREFAKFSNHQNENINGNTHEVHREEEHRKEASNNSMSTATKKSSIIKTIKISRNPAASDISSNDFNAIKASDQVGQGAIVQKQIVSKRTHTERNNCKAELEQFAQHTGARNTQRHRQAVVTGRPIKVASTSSTATDKCRKRTRFLITPKRRSWSESDLLKEIDNELQLAKGFLFADGG